ncbi:hypothetical protein [Sorangium cellulosum]|uniref:Uncharacterized protein n=1 Tax=Sorangium cellulosum So0157-2 TaxID=1254432 RepID=S4XZU6_SORCE|nr:hypothetical protein [Sorangium cellulosum]AGP37984.1 hypothetical protein SCE1572_28050 [Sorangium cellulosum So0157-2]
MADSPSEARVTEVADGIYQLLEPSEAMRRAMDYFAHGPDAPRLLEKLAATAPRLLACMHGRAYEGDGAALLRGLARALDAAT